MLLALVAAGPHHVLAGQQQYEPLADAVRTALRAAVSDRHAPEPVFDSLLHRVEWLAQMAERLPRRWKPTHEERIEFLLTARYEAQRAGLEPELVLALIQVESNFRRYAVSTAGARGYMQVMPFWSELIGDGEVSSLFAMRTTSLWLHDSSPLPGPRVGQPVSRAGSIQRITGQRDLPGQGARRLATLGFHCAGSRSTALR